MRSGCRLISTILSSLYLQQEENSWFLGTTFSGGYCTLLYAGQVSRGSPGFLADLEGACGCQGEEGSHSVVGVRCDMGPETQGSPLALHFLSLAIHHFCILTSVTWLSDS